MPNAQRQTTELAIRSLHPNFVGEIATAALAGLLSQTQDIKKELDRYGMLVFRRADISDSVLAEFGRRFGPLFNTGSSFGGAAAKTVLRLTNLDDQDRILPPSDKFRLANLSNALWHVDNSFSEPPAKYSLLLARVVPPAGGETAFADARSAYDALPDSMQHKIDGLRCHHSYIYSRSLTGVTDFSPEQRAALPPRVRPLVIHNRESGRKFLNVTSHISDVIGMSEQEGRALILELTEFATQPRFVYQHVWQPNELIMYDNQAVLHRARPFHDMAYPRDMRAIRVMHTTASTALMAEG